jgi:hypothetical protein
MTLRALLIERILFALTEEDLARNMTSAAELEELSDVDLFEIYENAIFEELL